MIRSALVAALLIASCAHVPCVAAEVREWTDQTGTVKKAGEFERFDGKSVHLKLADGQSFKVPLEWLSDADQAFAKAAAGAAIPADAINVVIVEGVGLDVEAARKDAYRAAVRQVLGTLVDSETLVENDRLVTDKVVLFSNGFVEKAEPLPDGETKDEGGLVRLRVKALVKAGRMAESLRSNNITPNGSLVTVSDPRSLLAQALTEQDRKENARELFLAAVADYPANCLTAEVGEPKIVEVKDGVAKCNVRIKVSAKQKEYDEFVRRLVTFLESGRIEAQGRFALTSDPTWAPPREDAAELLPKQTAEFLDAEWRAGNQKAIVWGNAFSWSQQVKAVRDSAVTAAVGFKNRTGAYPEVIVVYLRKASSYEGRWFVLNPQVLSWTRDLAQELTCRLVVRDSGSPHADENLIVRYFGYHDSKVRQPDQIATHYLFPGWHIWFGGQRDSTIVGHPQGLFGPALEFTTRLDIPQKAFDADHLDIEATLIPPNRNKPAEPVALNPVVSTGGGGTPESDDPAAILERVLKKQERDREALDAFRAAAKNYPASCFQAEAFPFTDKSLRPAGDDVECDVRVKISARPKEYEQFAKTLIAFLETLPPEAQCTCEVPDAGQLGLDAKSIRSFVRTPLIAEQLVVALDKQGNNPLVSFGSAWRTFPDGDGLGQFLKHAEAFVARTGSKARIVCIIPTAVPPFKSDWFAFAPERAKLFDEMTNSMTCTISVQRTAAGAGQEVVGLAEFGLATYSDQDWFFVLPGGITHPRGPAVHPTFEFTVPVTVPRTAFGKGMKVECTLTNGTEEGTSP